MARGTRSVKRLAFAAVWLLPAVGWWCWTAGDYAANRYVNCEYDRIARERSGFAAQAYVQGRTRERLERGFYVRAWYQQLPDAVRVTCYQVGIGDNPLNFTDGSGTRYTDDTGYGEWLWSFLAMLVWLLAFPLVLVVRRLKALEAAAHP